MLLFILYLVNYHYNRSYTLLSRNESGRFGALKSDSTFTLIYSQILLKLCSIIRYGGIEKELCVRQVLIKEISSHSWFLYAKEILDFYDLPSVFELIAVTPSKEKWKTYIKNKIYEYWKMQIEL